MLLRSSKIGREFFILESNVRCGSITPNNEFGIGLTNDTELNITK